MSCWGKFYPPLHSRCRTKSHTLRGFMKKGLPHNSIGKYKGQKGTLVPPNVFLVLTINSLTLHNNVRLLWVPGQSGILGYEKADFYACQASIAKCVGPEPVLGLSVQTVRTLLRDWSLREQLRLWLAKDGCSKRAFSGTSEAHFTAEA
jgi:hypothetical protein